MDDSLRTMMRQHLTQKREKVGSSAREKVKAFKQHKDQQNQQKNQPQISEPTTTAVEPEFISNNEEKGSKKSLPQGFFDDPVEDLKAHGIIKSYSEFKELRQKQDLDEFQSFMNDIEQITNETEPSAEESGIADELGNETVEVLPGNNILDSTENDILQYAYITKLASLYHQSEVVMKKYQPPTSSSISAANAEALQEMLQDAQTLAKQEEMIIHTTGVTLSDTTVTSSEPEGTRGSYITISGNKLKRKAHEKEGAEEDLTSLILQQLRKKKTEKRKSTL